jgi:hypothetical protein
MMFKLFECVEQEVDLFSKAFISFKQLVRGFSTVERTKRCLEWWKDSFKVDMAEISTPMAPISVEEFLGIVLGEVELGEASRCSLGRMLKWTRNQECFLQFVLGEVAGDTINQLLWKVVHGSVATVAEKRWVWGAARKDEL